MAKIIAVEILSPIVIEVLSALDPTIKELDYHTDLHGKYFVVNFPKQGKYVIMTPSEYHSKFTTEYGGLMIEMVQVIAVEDAESV